MSLGTKLKEVRKKSGLSQEQLTEKLCVSKQAVTKWESDRGLPDVENLKAIASLFDVSVDYLIADGTTLIGKNIKESIDLSAYEKSGKARSVKDAPVRAKFSAADIIYPLIRKKKLSLMENIIDIVVQPGTLHLADSLASASTAWYLVEEKDRQLLVSISNEFIESRELVAKFTGKKMVIDNQVFSKVTYTL